ncbi:MAG: S41 family peptidase [Dehalococcoidales bacterium]|nr:S41 family peptidase [Dehalococcoidales bacterium]
MRKIRMIIPALIMTVLLLMPAAGCALITVTTGPEPDAINEAWDIIFEDYVEKDSLDADILRQGAIRGMVEALDDPYTAYLDADAYQLSLSELEGKFDGIGASVARESDGKIIIVAPFPDSPAEKAGIRANDEVLEIDGKSVSAMSLVETVLLVRGPQGTTVTLLILHEGETEPVEIEVVRDEIEVTSVQFRMIGDIAYINITDFSGRTDAELLSALTSLIQGNARGIILDLRRNLGGTLTAVVDVASRFIPDGDVVSVVDSQGNRTTRPVVEHEVTTDLPMVVLVDSYSASGSEVLAGALQDYGRAPIAGSQTFGKGSVNILRRLSDGSGLYITFARWYTPNGRLIEGQGITPDYQIETEGEEIIEWAVDYLKNGG